MTKSGTTIVIKGVDISVLLHTPPVKLGSTVSNVKSNTHVL
jgi:hypothetical protein